MSRPETTFDKPEFALIPDERERDYANVSNLVSVQAGSKFKRVPIVVPTALFTLMKDVFKVGPEEKVAFYLVRDGDYFVFGMGWGEKDTSVADLWSYSDSSLPPFLR